MSMFFWKRRWVKSGILFWMLWAFQDRIVRYFRGRIVEERTDGFNDKDFSIGKGACFILRTVSFMVVRNFSM